MQLPKGAKNKDKLGFTLIELLVVFLIIGILTSLATVSYTQAQIKSRDNKRKSDLRAVQQALAYYLQVNGFYPFSQSGDILCPNGLFGTDVPWGTAFTCSTNSTTYMSLLPKDPISSQQYYYTSSATCVDFKICSYCIYAKMENTSDIPDTSLPVSSTTCPAVGSYNYYVTNNL